MHVSDRRKNTNKIRLFFSTKSRYLPKKFLQGMMYFPTCGSPSSPSRLPPVRLRHVDARLPVGGARGGRGGGGDAGGRQGGAQDVLPGAAQARGLLQQGGGGAHALHVQDLVEQAQVRAVHLLRLSCCCTAIGITKPPFSLWRSTGYYFRRATGWRGCRRTTTDSKGN